MKTKQQNIGCNVWEVIDAEVERLREVLDAAEKVVAAARKYECEELDGELSQALAEFDKLKEE